MADGPTTRASLLVRIRDAADQDAWEVFAKLYSPLVERYGRRAGLQDADAADLTQQLLQAVSGAIARLDYDPAVGTFRGWLLGIARRQLYRLREREQHAPRGSGDSRAQALLAELPAPEPSEAAWWEEEYKRQRFLWAVERVRGEFQERIWQAFWQTAVEGRGAAEVATELVMTVGADYTAKSRALDRIKREISGLQD